MEVHINNNNKNITEILCAFCNAVSNPVNLWIYASHMTLNLTPE